MKPRGFKSPEDFKGWILWGKKTVLGRILAEKKEFCSL